MDKSLVSCFLLDHGVVVVIAAVAVAVVVILFIKTTSGYAGSPKVNFWELWAFLPNQQHQSTDVKVK